MFRRHLAPSSELKVSRLFSAKCHFGENHVIDWDQVKVVGHESDRKTRWIKEAITIRKSKDKCMNRDTGSYFLPTSYDTLLRKPAHFHRNDTSR